MPTDPIQPFDPSVIPTGAPGGYSTNLLNDTPVPIFNGYQHGPKGKATAYTGANAAEAMAGPDRVPVYATVDDFMDQFDNLDHEGFLKIRNMLMAAGVISPTSSDPYSVRAAFSQILGDVEDINARHINISPLGYLKNLIRMNGIDPKDADWTKEDFQVPGQSQGFTGSKTQTNTSVSQISEGEAWSTLRQGLQAMLGRDPSDEEVRDFTYRMNQLAAQNPAISETITRYKNGDAISSNTKSVDAGFSGGDVQEAAYHDAVNDPQYAEYQSATTYFNAALSALGAIGQTG